MDGTPFLYTPELHLFYWGLRHLPLVSCVFGAWTSLRPPALARPQDNPDFQRPLVLQPRLPLSSAAFLAGGLRPSSSPPGAAALTPLWVEGLWRIPPQTSHHGSQPRAPRSLRQQPLPRPCPCPGPEGGVGPCSELHSPLGHICPQTRGSSKESPTQTRGAAQPAPRRGAASFHGLPHVPEGLGSALLSLSENTCISQCPLGPPMSSSRPSTVTSQRKLRPREAHRGLRSLSSGSCPPSSPPPCWLPSSAVRLDHGLVPHTAGA